MSETDETDLTPKHDYGPLRTYQVTYKSGHIERVRGHQVTLPSALGLTALLGGPAAVRRDMIVIHGEFEGNWRLALAVREELVESVRDVTDADLWAQLDGGVS